MAYTPKYPLKMWGDKSWCHQATDTLFIGMVDENMPIPVEQTLDRKPFYLRLTQSPAVLPQYSKGREGDLGLTDGTAPEGSVTMLLSDTDILALMDYCDGFIEAMFIEQGEDGRFRFRKNETREEWEAEMKRLRAAEKRRRRVRKKAAKKKAPARKAKARRRR